MKEYIRKPLFDALWQALHSKPNFIEVVTGPRQVGKTTLALQVFAKWQGPKIYESADLPSIPSLEWIITHWQRARQLYKSKGKDVLLVLDEVQKIPHWSQTVKKLFDEDKRLKNRLRVVLLGSSALLMQRGLSESLAGRFEIHRHNHWSYSECREYFSLKLDEYLYFGGYPAALSLRYNQERWARYIRDSLIETVLSKDVLLMMPVTKPALLRQIFGLAVIHPACILSYQKMLGSLQDAGNTTTIASYIRLLSKAFLVTALERYSGSKIKTKGSIPKLLVLDNSLISAMSGYNLAQSKRDKIFWGRIIENAVGAKLYAILEEKGARLFYWRQRQNEVDYIIQIGKRLIAVEVKSTFQKDAETSLSLFMRRYKKTEPILISPFKKAKREEIKYITLEQFFTSPSEAIGL
jgi:hypothetical protein